MIRFFNFFDRKILDFFKQNQQRELTINLSPSGKVIGFVDQWPQRQSAPSVSQIEAQENRINITADSVSNDGGAIERRIARRSFKKTFIDYHNQLDFDAATATFVDGLLRISIPPQKVVRPIEISID